MTERISLKETYDNRDVIAWLVQQKAQIDDILTRIEGIETIPDNVGSDLRPIRRDNGQFVAVSKNLVQADNTAVGTDTKPVKIFNGEAIPVNYDLLSGNGDQYLNGSMIERREIELSTITGSTQIRGMFIYALLNDVAQNVGEIQWRRYANRTRAQINIVRFNDSPQGACTLRFEAYDTGGRVILAVDNNVNGVTTSHSIIDSTP